DADALGNFAKLWHADSRAASRRLLFEYLDRPLNAFRHEALVKRLFKLAEAAGDDELMVRFLVAFDRSVGRIRRTRTHSKTHGLETEEAARKLGHALRSQGYANVNRWAQSRTRHLVWATWSAEALTPPRGTAMPREKLVDTYGFDAKTRSFRIL